MDFGHKKPRHCSCCGERVMDPGSTTLPNYRLVMFELSNGQQTPVSLCEGCTGENWEDPERLTALKAQMNDAMEQSTKGLMYALREDGTWNLAQIGTPLPPEVARPELETYLALSVVRPLTLGRFLVPETLLVLG